MTAPINGATQNSQSCPSAQPLANIAGPVLRAGLTDVFVTGMSIRWIKVRQNPMANPALAVHLWRAVLWTQSECGYSSMAVPVVILRQAQRRLGNQPLAEKAATAAASRGLAITASLMRSREFGEWAPDK